jgi:RNA polymerase sigma-70 factor (ECF subfamily)
MQELALLMVSDCADAQEPEFARLVRKAKAGDAAAFEAILCQFERRVLLTAMRLLNGNLEDAKDAAQQVFLRLHRSLHQLDASRHFTSWLYRITVNVCRDMLRVRARRPVVPLDEAGHCTIAGGTEDAIRRDEQMRLIYAALATLSEHERAAIVLRDLEGISTTEVARILQSSEGTVRSQISYARVKIRKFVDRQQRQQKRRL